MYFGAFGEDFYHAAMVDTDVYLARCFTYIDLNMVRAGVVGHPREWREAGYREIQNPPKRYWVIDRRALAELLAVDEGKLARVQNEWIEASLERAKLERAPQWSEALAVGRRSFVEEVKEELGQRGRHRRVEEWGRVPVLREAAASYSRHFGLKIIALTRNIVPDPRQR